MQHKSIDNELVLGSNVPKSLKLKKIYLNRMYVSGSQPFLDHSTLLSITNFHGTLAIVIPTRLYMYDISSGTPVENH